MSRQLVKQEQSMASKPVRSIADIQKRRDGALKARHKQLLQTIDRWNALARGLGYEGVNALVEHLSRSQHKSDSRSEH
jgi:nucleotidyltransferase/DNA polymerase involved in DNA repair